MVHSEKLVGYCLLAVGLVIIILAAFNVYQVFNALTKPVQLFSFPAVSLDLSSLGGGLPISAEAKAELLPATVLNQSANIAAHLFLMGFVVSVGYKIASLGVQLVRTIEVKVRGLPAQAGKTEEVKA
ncbi:MAG: hypothetical protein US96_C0003G0029 [Candidatus Woesebacteria bacterium GW2011_GWB1_38_5b]|uniref:Uncharacterized protein n=1 Tax=Candidatus Woesebacteria bacterium GW2011_GWB1_38_5b TaxID=1618569 RepID=A0A0G0NFI4_9BACT|nr:MAG: hypothetical protein US96_C0003G0029 [Candidatus Woesebacteria bacterium GW2011_GWB1_38_5b]KKQ76804.1 MAG: hypothetical protein UT00_C0032G0006 [Parcubacteria group bacterium GW2011_GWA1_38_7]